MKGMVLFCVLMMALSIPVSGLEYAAPEAPEDALALMPVESESFGEDLWQVITTAVAKAQPEWMETITICLTMVAVTMLAAMIKTVPGNVGAASDLTAVAICGIMLLRTSGSMATLAADTVNELSEYGKLLLPVMAAALASQGGITTSSALYSATALFDAVLSGCITRMLVPMVYVYLALAVAAAVTGDKLLSGIRELLKNGTTWCLKTLLYVFTAYIGITGAVSGTTDAAALKATKLTMSGMVPVVGGILADASEAVIVGAGVMKNAVGVYGTVALIAIWITPFLRIGILYLVLKLSAALCGVFECKPVQELIASFGSAMGLLLGMVGACCVLLLISMVCFMKGVA